MYLYGVLALENMSRWQIECQAVLSQAFEYCFRRRGGLRASRIIYPSSSRISLNARMAKGEGLDEPWGTEEGTLLTIITIVICLRRSFSLRGQDVLLTDLNKP